MAIFSPTGGYAQVASPSGVNNESLIALPSVGAGVDTVRIANCPNSTWVKFGTSTVTFAGNAIGMLLAPGTIEYYSIPSGATHAVFFGGGTVMKNINIVTGKMV